MDTTAPGSGLLECFWLARRRSALLCQVMSRLQSPVYPIRHRSITHAIHRCCVVLLLCSSPAADDGRLFFSTALFASANGKKAGPAVATKGHRGFRTLSFCLSE